MTKVDDVQGDAAALDTQSFRLSLAVRTRALNGDDPKIVQ
jgi:hypothetical protein